MRKISFGILVTIAAFLNVVSATTVTESQARAIAGRFFNVDMPQRPAALKGKGAAAAYYVFNNPEQPGWVIVAGDDRARTILAYGDESYFDDTEVPECVQDWLNDYAEQLAHLDTAQNESLRCLAATGRRGCPSTSSAPPTPHHREPPVTALQDVWQSPWRRFCTTTNRALPLLSFLPTPRALSIIIWKNCLPHRSTTAL